VGQQLVEVEILDSWITADQGHLLNVLISAHFEVVQVNDGQKKGKLEQQNYVEQDENSQIDENLL